ncbi:MAG: PTS sugar transporter subunit IIA [Oscillospiraceae bacterium]|nr:PTS sugar transporter subunit IIA [Oscillospiraceae bacterium]
MNVFDEKNIVLAAAPADKMEAIRMAGEVLLGNGYVKSAYLDDMVAREQLVTTYIGNYVAIPHGLHTSGENILSSGISFVQVPGGVEFGDVGEGKTAYLVIGIAGKDGSHMEILSQVAMVLTDLDQVERLRTAQTPREVLEVFGAVLN